MAGAKIERLLRGIEAIYADLGDPGDEATEGFEPLSQEEGGGPLEPEAEAQVEAVLRTLRRIGAAARAASALPAPTPNIPHGAIGGAALLMRSDLLMGRGTEIPGRLPAFVYLTTLFFLGQGEAEGRCREVEALIEAEGFNIG